MESKWYIDIYPRDNYMISYSLQYGEGSSSFYISKVCDVSRRLIVKSEYVEGLTNSEEVYNYFYFLLTIFNGYNLLIHEDKSDYRKAYLGDLYIDDVKIATRFNVDLSSVNLQGSSDSICKEAPFSKVLNLIFKEDGIEHLFVLLGGGMDFYNMYKVFETVEFLLKGKSNQKDLFSKTKAKRFKRTANNFKYLRYEARHGLNKNPIDNPMNLKEAQLFISDLVNVYLERYHNIELPIVLKRRKIDVNSLF